MVLAHPTKEHLAGYATGALSDGKSLLVASHLTYCAACRAEVARFETLGSAILMSETQGSGITPPSVDKALAALDGLDLPAESNGALKPIQAGPLPAPVRDEIQVDYDKLGWKFRLPGVHEYVLDGFEGEHVSLLKVRPGAHMLAHTHEAEELTLILSGQMEDHGQTFRRGDVALADRNDDHQPRVTGDEVCVCLIVLSGNMKFTGPVGRALNIFTR